MKLFYVLTLAIWFACGGTLPQDQAMGVEGMDEREMAESDSLDVWSTDYIMGKFEPSVDTNFTLVDKMYADREGLYLRKDTYRAFKSMYEKAHMKGIKLVIRSATRNFEYQKEIWENKWNGTIPLESNVRGNTITDETIRAQEILKYSSMPGSSRHHWGTDLDLNAFNNAYFEHGKGREIYTWLQENAATFGFCQPYSSKDTGRPGYHEEKWHWSYIPIANQLTKSAKLYLTDQMISGFLGAEQAPKLSIVQNYVMGIDTTCLIDTSQTILISN